MPHTRLSGERGPIFRENSLARHWLALSESARKCAVFQAVTHIPIPISNHPDLQLEFWNEVERVLDRINVVVSSPAYSAHPDYMPILNVVFDDVPRKERVIGKIIRELDNNSLSQVVLADALMEDWTTLTNDYGSGCKDLIKHHIELKTWSCWYPSNDELRNYFIERLKCDVAEFLRKHRDPRVPRRHVSLSMDATLRETSANNTRRRQDIQRGQWTRPWGCTYPIQERDLRSSSISPVAQASSTL